MPMTMVGALLAGRILQFSRKKCLLIISLVGFVGISLQLVESIWFIFLGRVIMGLPQGIYMVCSGRIIEEHTPPHLFGTTMVMMSFLSEGVVSLTTIIASTGLPDPKDINGNKTSEYWRVFVGFPLIFCVISLTGLLVFMKYETPKLLIS